MVKKATTQDKQSQRQLFINTARELGCDEDEERFVEAVRKVASAPPAPKTPKAKKAR